MIVSVVTFTTIVVVSDVIPGIWRGTMASRAVPFSLCMACRGTVSCETIVSDAAKLNGAGTVVQIVLIVAVAVLTTEIMPINV